LGERHIGYLIFTANGASLTDDMFSRSLMIHLHQAFERPSDRQYKRDFEDAEGNVLTRLRPDVLAACWALVRLWLKKGRPGPSSLETRCKHWGLIIGGIVQAAGFECPFKSRAKAPVDQTTLNMRELVATMLPCGTEFSFKQLVAKSGELGLFPYLLESLPKFVSPSNPPDSSLPPKPRATMGRIFEKWVNRRVDKYVFRAKGESVKRNRVFWIERISDDDQSPPKKQKGQ
jgi:hypothetical protein